MKDWPEKVPHDRIIRLEGAVLGALVFFGISAVIVAMIEGVIALL